MIPWNKLNYTASLMPVYKTMGHVFTLGQFLKKVRLWWQAKSRLVPIKENTMAILELLENILLSTLMISVKNPLPKLLAVSDCFYWTGSQVIISCIKVL